MIVNTAELKRALRASAKVAKFRNTIPVLSHVSSAGLVPMARAGLHSGVAMKKEEDVYHYRGRIERAGKRLFAYRWVDGWSRTTEDGSIEYPWVTKAEARAESPGCTFERGEE